MRYSFSAGAIVTWTHPNWSAWHHLMFQGGNIVLLGFIYRSLADPPIVRSCSPSVVEPLPFQRKAKWIFQEKSRVWYMSGKWDMMHPRFGQDLGGRCQILWQNPELGCLHSKSCSINCPCYSSNRSNQSWSSLIVYLSLFLLTIQSYSRRGFKIKYYNQGLFSTFHKRITKNASVGKSLKPGISLCDW